MSIGTLRGEPDEVRKIHLARVNALAAGLRAERAKSAELLAALVQLLTNVDYANRHSGECASLDSRGDNVIACDCGVSEWRAHAEAARAAIARATGGEP